MTLVEGSTFCISEPGGDIRPGHAQGLFVRDTRVLSRWELTVDGSAPQPLTVQQAEPYAAAFLCRLPPPAGLADSTLLVVRPRYVGDGMREDVTIRNTAPMPATCVVTLAADADFADLFEVKDGRPRPQAAASASAGDSALRFDCRRGERHHELLIGGDERPSAADGVLAWRAAVPARGQWTATVEAVPVTDGVAMKLRHPRGQAVEHAIPRAGCGSGGDAVRRCARRTVTSPACSTAASRTSARCASSTPSTRAAGRGRGRAVVHGAVRPGLATDRVDAAAVGRGARPRHPADAGCSARKRDRRRVGRAAGQDLARDAIRIDGRARARRALRTTDSIATPLFVCC